MQIAVLIISSLIFIAVFFLFKSWKSRETLSAVAIACAVNTAYYTNRNFPTTVGPFTFGVDAIIYPFFIFCIFMICIERDEKSAAKIVVNAMVASFLPVVFDVIAKVTYYKQLNYDCINMFLLHSIYIVGSIVALLITFPIFKRMKQKNHYVALTFNSILAVIINAIFYYPGYFVIYYELKNDTNAFISMVSGGILQKSIMILALVLGLFIYRKLKKEE